MARFSLEFDTDNAAFDYTGGVFEIQRILRHVADQVPSMVDSTAMDTVAVGVRDGNGNTIGQWRWTTE